MRPDLALERLVSIFKYVLKIHLPGRFVEDFCTCERQNVFYCCGSLTERNTETTSRKVRFWRGDDGSNDDGILIMEVVVMEEMLREGNNDDCDDDGEGVIVVVVMMAMIVI